jgi:tyrosine-protein phosphatase SIW14
MRVAAFLLALAISAPAPALAGKQAAGVVSNVRIENFGRVSDSYFRGAQPQGGDYSALAAMGIKTVIDLQEDFDRSEESQVKRAGMNFYRIPMSTHRPPTDAEQAHFLRLVNDPANQPVYVHCKGGRHRTGVMTALYRLTNDGWTADKAFSEMKQYDFGPDMLHPEFKRFVYAYYTGHATDSKAGVRAVAAQQQ